MTLGVVIPCYRQERWLPRTVAAIEAALAGREWRGTLVLAAPSDAAPALSGPRWRVLSPPIARPLTPGAARMLGFSDCGGDWVLFVDADVEVDAAWMAEAIATARRAEAERAAAAPAGRARPAPAAAAPPLARVAGLWGRLEEWFVDERGERPGSRDLYRVGDEPRDTAYTATLSFYRRDALTAAGGYDARLHSEEDFELGLRLRRLGFRMRSLGLRAGRHWSAPRPSFDEIARRWRTGLCLGMGEALRLYVGRPGFAALLRRQLHYLVVLAMWLAGAAAAAAAAALRDPRPLAWWLAAPLALFAVMSVRKRSPRLALHSILTWTVNAAGLVAGFLSLPAPAEPVRPGIRP